MTVTGDDLVGHGAPLDDEIALVLLAAQMLFLEIGLLHQPMGEAAQQFGLRAAAFIAARPQPAVIGKKDGDAAFAFARQHEQRLVVRPRHHGFAALGLGIDKAEPAAPGAARAVGSPGRSRVTGWRLPIVGHLRLERRLR